MTGISGSMSPNVQPVLVAKLHMLDCQLSTVVRHVGLHVIRNVALQLARICQLMKGLSASIVLSTIVLRDSLYSPKTKMKQIIIRMIPRFGGYTFFVGKISC